MILYIAIMLYQSLTGVEVVGVEQKFNIHTKLFYKFFLLKSRNKIKGLTERGGSVVTHETRIREVPGSNPGADQPDWFFFFVVSLSQQGKCWVGFSLPRSI